MKENILITNGQLRKALSSVRALGEMGFKVYVGEVTRFNISGFSKYCTENLVYPSPSKEPESFKIWLLDVLKKYEIDALIPMDDDVMRVIIKNREAFENLTHILLPESKIYEEISDKWGAVKLAEGHGLKTPYTVCPKDLNDAQNLSEHLKYPLIVKARHGSGSRGIRIVHDLEGLKEAYQDVDAWDPRPMIQERIPTGPRFDVCLLFDKDHKCIRSFSQREVRHFPLEMGPSTVQVSIDQLPFTDMCIKMLETIKWVGIAEFEFMLDEDTNTYYFMEINTRFWNSLELSRLCGVDFSYAYYMAAKATPLSRENTYQKDVYCRWSLPGDICHFIANHGKTKMTPPLMRKGGMVVFDDIISKSDPLPTFGFILAVGKYIFNIEMWQFFFKR